MKYRHHTGETRFANPWHAVAPRRSPHDSPSSSFRVFACHAIALAAAGRKGRVGLREGTTAECGTDLYDRFHEAPQKGSAESGWQAGPCVISLEFARRRGHGLRAQAGKGNSYQ